jgi:acetyl esterase
MGARVVDGFFRTVSLVGGSLPIAQPHRHGVELLPDLPYQFTKRREHLLDIYRPKDRTGPVPVILYSHGGGFRILSKETHWIFGLGYARNGYLVVNINYRLSPDHPFPAALEDAAAAYEWTVRHIAEYGGDPSRIAVAGESAGANIATALTIACCTERPEPWAKRLFDLGVVPEAVLPACGLLQVSDTERFARKGKLPAVILDRLTEVSDAYLGAVRHLPKERLGMADPLLILEDPGTHWARPLPPFFAPCGTADPVLDDTRRLAAALAKLHVECEARYYKGGPHAFHAFYPLPIARQCWKDMLGFLSRRFPLPAVEGAVSFQGS